MNTIGGTHSTSQLLFVVRCGSNFSGKERDTESGNDYFEARYYSSNMGRFMSPDWSAQVEPIPYSKLDDPQSLNLYAYVGNNPLARMDVDGHMGSVAEQKANELEDYIFGGGVGQRPGDEKQSIGSAAQGIAAGNSKGYLQGQTSGAYPANSNKCNKLPADASEQSGRPRPRVPKGGIWGKLGFTRDPTAHEWADPNVAIPGWSKTMPLSAAEPNDVIAQQHGQWGHTGVVVMGDDGTLQTVSVNSTTNPAGIVTQNGWGFRPRGQIGPGQEGPNGEGPNDPAPVVRRYVGDAIQ